VWEAQELLGVLGVRGELRTRERDSLGLAKTPIGRYIPRKERDGEAVAFPGVVAIAKMAVRCENGCGVGGLIADAAFPNG